MAETEKIEKRAVLLTGIDELSPKLTSLRATVDAFRSNLEQAGLGRLDISGVFKGGSVVTPFVEGIKAAAAFQGQLTEVSQSAKSVDVPSVPNSATQSLNVFSASMGQVAVAVDAALLPAVGAVVVGLEPLLKGVGTLLNDNPELVQGIAAGAIAFSAIQAAVAGTTQALDLMSTVLKASPLMLIAMGIALVAGVIVVNWKPISAFFAGLWREIASVVMPMVECFKTMFAFTPLGMIINHWGPISQVFGAIWDGIKAVATPIIGFFRELFSWTPLGLIMDNWGPVTGLFSAIWDVLKALTVPVMDVLRNLFNWSPLGLIVGNWGAITEVFASIWEGIKHQALIGFATFGAVFSWSPLETITQQWEPVTQWFSTWWEKMRAIMAPIKELFGGSFGGFVTKITGKVEGLAQAQQATNAEGQDEFAPAFFGANSDSRPLPSHLPQGSNALVQQFAANSRTQLEGGLTVRFENAPAGMRTDQPHTNQPGLALTPQIGYRSLSLGGSNELA